MILTLILSEEKLRPLGSKEKKASENIKKGQIYNNVKVVDINADGLGVEIDGIKALLPKNHLTDNCSIADLILDTYNVNDVINNVICFEKDVLPIMSLKPSILSFEGCDMTFDEIHDGQVIPTVVSNIKDYGIFVKLPMWKIKKSALIPLRHLADDFVQDPNEHVQVQQTVYAQIIEKSENEQKITMTSKPSLIQQDQSNLTLSLFQDLEKVKKSKEDTIDYQLGDVVNCVVQEVTEFGLDTLIEGYEG